MTKEQAHAIIDTMRMDAECKTALKRQCDQDQQGARWIVAMWARKVSK